ncbi:MAG: hypothetical protein KKE23_01975 [Nanoarchaeota archaeon]|nr:hypothetical protein [Nanoarchaeota archaeon]
MSKIYFKNKEINKKFFIRIKEENGLSYSQIISLLKISKATFWRYFGGKSGIPEEKFSLLCRLLKSDQKDCFIKETYKKEDNWGQKIGGNIAYQINKKEFESGRKIGMKKIISSNKIRYSKENYPLNMALSTQLCEVIGAHMGDGFTNKYGRLYMMQFSGDKRFDKSYYEKFIIPYILKVFPSSKPHISEEKNGNSLRVTFYSKHLFLFLTERMGFPAGKKTFTICIPQEIMNSEEKLINSTIRGIFDTDGCVFIDQRKKYKRPYPRIILEIVSSPLHNQLKEYLKKHFNIYTIEKERPGKNKTYSIEIYGIAQLKKWMEIIGFSNNRHLSKIALVAQSW